MIVLGLVIAGQWVLIWKLLERLLAQAKIPAIAPVRVFAPEEKTEHPDTRKKLFSVRLPE